MRGTKINMVWQKLESSTHENFIKFEKRGQILSGEWLATKPGKDETELGEIANDEGVTPIDHRSRRPRPKFFLAFGIQEHDGCVGRGGR